MKSLMKRRVESLLKVFLHSLHVKHFWFKQTCDSLQLYIPHFPGVYHDCIVFLLGGQCVDRKHYVQRGTSPTHFTHGLFHQEEFLNEGYCVLQSDFCPPWLLNQEQLLRILLFVLVTPYWKPCTLYVMQVTHAQVLPFYFPPDLPAASQTELDNSNVLLTQSVPPYSWFVSPSALPGTVFLHRSRVESPPWSPAQPSSLKCIKKC